MEYVEITIKVPAGYEDVVRKVVQSKVESILANTILTPTSAQKSDFNTKVLETRDFNIKK